MPRKVDHDERRRQLVEASWNVLCNEGLEGVSLRRVAEAADCTTGRIAHYFEGRDALLAASLRMAHKQTADRMRRIAATQKDPKIRLRDILLESLPLDERRHREWKVWLSFWAAAIGNEELAAENVLRYREWADALSAALSPIVGEPKANATAQTLVTLVDGLAIGATLNPSEEMRQYIVSQIDQRLAELN